MGAIGTWMSSRGARLASQRTAVVLGVVGLTLLALTVAIGSQRGSASGSQGADGEVEVTRVCVDRRREWSHCKNVWHNAGIRSAMHMLGTPFRALRPRRRDG